MFIDQQPASFLEGNSLNRPRDPAKQECPDLVAVDLIEHFVSSTGIEIVGDAVDAGIAIARGPATRRTPTPDRARPRSRFTVVAIATRATRLVCQILYQQGEHEHRGQESEPEQKTRKIIHVSLP